jgi:uncharacterized protein (TIGR03083 family)
MDLWAELADERRLVAAELDDAPEPVWGRPTTCGGWTVHELTAHLTVSVTFRWPELLTAMVRARGNADRAIADMTERRATQPPSELVRTLRERADVHFAPPGLGPVAPLTDIVVHGIELRRAAAIERDVAPGRLRAALDFASGGRATGFVPGKRTKGLRFEATDMAWSGGPAGAPVVRGPVEDLLLAVTGRPSALDALEGDGVGVLAARL